MKDSRQSNYLIAVKTGHDLKFPKPTAFLGKTIRPPLDPVKLESIWPLLRGGTRGLNRGALSREAEFQLQVRHRDDWLL